MLLAIGVAILYLLSAVLLGRQIAHADAPPSRALLPALLAVAMHAAVHVVATLASGQVDLHFFAALSIVALALAAMTAVLSLLRPIGALGIVVFPIAAAAALLYAFAGHRPAHEAPGWQILLHAWLALFAYATLSLAALVAIMGWLQERALRRRQLATALRAFPPLTLIETLLFRLVATGFALLTLALLTGVVFVENLFAQHLVHKTVLSLLAWATFGALLFGRLRYGWRGRRAVRWTLVAMALLALAFFGSEFVLQLVLMRTRS